MKNVTITLDDQTAEWARKAAAEQGKSLSRFVGDMLRKQLPGATSYEAAMNRWLAREATLKPLREPGEKLPARDEIYDRPVFRRR